MIADADAQIRDAVELYRTGRLVPGSMIWRIAEFIHWAATGGCVIRDVHGNLVCLRFNLVQRIILGKMLKQAARSEPIRVVVFKARKTGVSTLIQVMFVRFCQVCQNQIAKTIAHKSDSLKEIFKISQLAAKHGGTSEGDEILRTELRFDTQSSYNGFTAGGEGVGAGGTPSLLHLSEVGLWPGVLTPERAKETEYSATVSVPNVPETIIVYESTSRGRNLMWDRFQDARHGNSRYVAVFVPWYWDSRNTSKVKGVIQLDEEEQALNRLARADGVEITPGMFQWRREEIRELGPELFKQEFPATPEEAIQGQRGLVVPGLHTCVVDKLPFVYEGVPPECRVGGWDHGFNDPSALGTGVIWDRTLWIIDVWRGAGLIASQMVSDWTIWPEHTYYCDPTALGARKELQAACRRRGINARFVQAPAGRGKAPGDREEDSWDKLRRYVRNGWLKIHKDAAEQILLEGDNLFFHPTTGKPEKKRSEACGHFDTLDMVRYMTAGVSLDSETVLTPIRRPRSRRDQLRG